VTYSCACVRVCASNSAFNYDAQDRDFLYIRSVCFHPSGKYLACGDEDKTVKLWDMETKTVSHTFTGHELDIYSLDFSSDGNIIVSGSGDKKVKIWDLAKRTCLETLGNDEVGPKDGVTSVAISPDGRLVAAVCIGPIAIARLPLPGWPRRCVADLCRLWLFCRARSTTLCDCGMPIRATSWSAMKATPSRFIQWHSRPTANRLPLARWTRRSRSGTCLVRARALVAARPSRAIKILYYRSPSRLMETG
jgi:hypothetical protein